MGRLEVVSLTEGFFSGGARKQHTGVMLGLQQRGYEQSALSINSQIVRENTVQPMEQNSCYQSLRKAGITIRSLGRQATGEINYTPFTPAEMYTFNEATRSANLLLSVKEQPVRLVTQAKRLEAPVLVELHRSDPEHQGHSLKHLHQAIKMGRVTGMIATAEAAKRAYCATGISSDMIDTIRNGVDLGRFYPSQDKRQAMRDELRINYEVPLVAYAARFDEMKNVPLFLESARIYLESIPSAHVVMCGAGMTYDNLEKTLIKTFHGAPELMQRLHTLGIRHDMDRVLNAADITSLTSKFGETYPLALMEGLACNAIPVTTAVGDAAHIASEGRGIVTPPHPQAIASAWNRAYTNRDEHRAAIKTTRDQFDHSKMMDRYDTVIRTHLR